MAYIRSTIILNATLLIDIYCIIEITLADRADQNLICISYSYHKATSRYFVKSSDPKDNLLFLLDPKTSGGI